MSNRTNLELAPLRRLVVALRESRRLRVERGGLTALEWSREQMKMLADLAVELGVDAPSNAAARSEGEALARESLRTTL